MFETPRHSTTLAIAMILLGVFAISINDMLIKQLSGAYPLHEIVFARSAIAVILTLVVVRLEGGWRILKTAHPFLHMMRGVFLVAANMSFFAALAALPLADATALFFVAPLFITLLSIPLLGEKVGPMRLGAVLAGFAGVVIMQRPWASQNAFEVSRLVLLLPVFAALMYALNQLMTRKLGGTSKASALSVYVHLSFIVVSLAFFVAAGDGRFAAGHEGPSLQFLLRSWVWPVGSDWWILIGMGANAAIVGYCLSQAYRLADAATVAPFEYIGLAMAVFWGWAIFGELPRWEVWTGIALILSSGLVVFVRERNQARILARAPVNRR